MTGVGLSVGSNSQASLGTLSNQVCYLSGISGQFHGSGEEVRVFHDSAFWFVKASAASTGVWAEANCISTSAAMSNEVVWSQAAGHRNNQLIELGPTGYQHCFLTRLGGHFQGAGETIRIVDQQVNGVWHHYITGTAGASGLNIVGGAACVASYSNNQNYSVTQSSQWTRISGSAYYVSGSNFVCRDGIVGNPNALTSITGKFEGWGESVYVGLNTSPWGTTCGLVPGASCSFSYYVSATSRQRDVAGTVANMIY
jgi:hypothetical protein